MNLPSTEHVGLTFLFGKLLASDAGPGSRFVLATLLGCTPSHNLASWENKLIAWAAASFAVRFESWKIIGKFIGGINKIEYFKTSISFKVLSLD